MKLWVIIARVFTIAYDIFGTLVIGVFIGIALDRLLSTKVVFTIGFSILGIVQGLRMLLKIGETNDSK